MKRIFMMIAIALFTCDAFSQSLAKTDSCYYLQLPFSTRECYDNVFERDSKLVLNLYGGMTITTFAMNEHDIPDDVFVNPCCVYVYRPVYKISFYQYDLIIRHRISSAYRFVTFQERPLFKFGQSIQRVFD